jgi:hypothetical protein
MLEFILFITVEPAPIVDHEPISIPGITVVPAPIQVPSPTFTLPHKEEFGEICT